MNKLIKYLKNKKIIILGFGKEGLSTYHLLRKYLPNKILILADKNNIKIFPNKIQNLIKKDRFLQVYFGDNYLSSLNQGNLIIKTPGIKLKTPEIKESIRRGIVVTSQTQLFFEFSQGIVIGVTGTKGKSTTTSVIYKMLKTAGKKVYLIGNIGNPALPYLKHDSKNTFFTYELSSHQLAELTKSPRFAVWLNLYSEHLDYYRNLKDYKMAKARITLFQKGSDYFLYKYSDLAIRRIANITKAKTIPFGLEKEAENLCFLDREEIVFKYKKRLQSIMPISEIPLRGKFNLYNVMPAIIIGRLLNIPIKTIRKALKNFKPLRYRLAYVGKYMGIDFYNDTLATIPEATMAAIETLGPNVETIMLGGFERGINYNKFARFLLKSAIKNYILFPQTGIRIYKSIEKYKKNKKVNYYFVDNMKEAVTLAFKHTAKGKICLHSPAAPACGFGFKDYIERGASYHDEIIKYIQFLTNKKKK